MRTANPALNDKTFAQFDVYDAPTTMTVKGTATKTVMLLLLLVLAAGFTWSQVQAAGNFQQIAPWIFGGAIVGFIFAIITCFKPNWAPVTAPIYATAEGLFLGGLSALVEMKYPGIAFQAVCLTIGTLFTLMIAYQAGWIRASENFKAGVTAATGGIFMIYMATWILGFFGVGIPFIHEAGLIGIGFSVFVVIVAALNLVLDFDFIEEASARGAPKYMEWYGAFGLLVTLVWLYIEILRLLAKLRGRR